MTAKVQANMQAKARTTAVQANGQLKEQGNVNTEHLLLLSGASRNDTPSNPESNETSAPEPSHPGPAGASRIEAVPLRRRRSSEDICMQPGFAVVGLVGTFGERVLLLPTEEGRQRLAVENVASAAAAAAANDDGEGSAACDCEGKGEGLCRVVLCSIV